MAINIRKQQDKLYFFAVDQPEGVTELLANVLSGLFSSSPIAVKDKALGDGFQLTITPTEQTPTFKEEFNVAFNLNLEKEWTQPKFTAKGQISIEEPEPEHEPEVELEVDTEYVPIAVDNTLEEQEMERIKSMIDDKQDMIVQNAQLMSTRIASLESQLKMQAKQKHELELTISSLQDTLRQEYAKKQEHWEIIRKLMARLESIEKSFKLCESNYKQTMSPT